MLNTLHRIAEIDDRYATNAERIDLEQLARSFDDRLRLYQKLAQAEAQILAALDDRLRLNYPHWYVLDLFVLSGGDVSQQGQHDVRYTFRHAIQSMLLGEAWLQEALLLWSQGVTRPLQLQAGCDIVYSTLEHLLEAALSPQDSQIICPIIRRVRESLTLP